MKTESSRALTKLRLLLSELLRALESEYESVSILASDVKMKNYQVSRQGVRIAENDTFGHLGFTARAFFGGSCAEVSRDSLSREDLPEILADFKERLFPFAKKAGPFPTPAPAGEERLKKVFHSSYALHPALLGDEKIIERLSGLREQVLKTHSSLTDLTVRYNYQEQHRLYLSGKKDLEQNLLFCDEAVFALGRKGEEVKSGYAPASLLGGAELLDCLGELAEKAVESLSASLQAEPVVPGVYDCICSPEVTGMIAHEAFGHGVEMDMFVKNRALAKDFIGRQVASELVTMKDGAATDYEDVASFFFDDEGVPAGETVIIKDGILLRGISDELSALRLGTGPTGNGRRQAVDHKAYSRMTNTFFAAGTSTEEEMIRAVSDGLLLECPMSGMEDPKNWGIQCMVSYGREIKDGALTGRIFGPIVLTGCVPDLLKSISMVSDRVEHCGSGACGKGWKEWVKVSDGGPFIRARIRLG